MESRETFTGEPSTERHTASDFDVREVEQRLKSLKRDLEEYIESDWDGVVMACLSVWQDVNCEDVGTSGPPSVTLHGLPGSSETTGGTHRPDSFSDFKDGRLGDGDRNLREVKRKRAMRGCKGQRQGKESPSRLHRTVECPSVGRWPEGEEHHPTEGEASGRFNGASNRTVSLKDVISAFDSLKEKRSSTYIPSLPPLPEVDATRATVSDTREAMEAMAAMLARPSEHVMDVDARPVVGTASASDKPAMEVYVMPSGYIVQSARMVMQQKQESKPSIDRPLYQPTDYAVKSGNATHVAVRSEMDAETKSGWVDVDIQRTAALMSPRTEKFDDGHILQSVDSESFLSRMEMQDTPLYPHSSETIRPNCHIVREVLDVKSEIEIQSMKNGFSTPEGSKGSTSSPMSSEIEALLQRFDERMEKL